MIFIVYWVWLPQFVNYSISFWLFLRKYLILERQLELSGCEWEKYEPSILVPKSQKSWGKSGGQKVYSCQAL